MGCWVNMCALSYVILCHGVLHNLWTFTGKETPTHPPTPTYMWLG